MKTGKQEIPGYYYDPQKDRYFKIIPGRPPPADSSSDKDTIKEGNPSLLSKEVKKAEAPAKSSIHLIRERVLGKCSPLEFRRKYLYLSIAAKNWPDFDKAALLLRRNNPYPDNLDSHIQVIAPKPHHDGIAILSKIAEQERTLFQLYKISSDRNTPISFTHVYPGFVLEQISSVCWNPHDESGNTILLSTLLSDSGSLLLYAFENFQDNLEDSPLAFRHERYRTRVGCIWTAKWNPNPNYKNMIGLGTYSGFTLRTIGSWRNERVIRVGSDVFTLEFGTQNPTLFCGARDGKLRIYDLRMINAGPRQGTNYVMAIGKSLDWIKLTQDEQKMLVSTLDGKLQLWDLRSRKCIGDCLGHRNSHSRLSPGLLPNEEFVYAVGEDKACRIWHTPSGTLVKNIPYPFEVDNKTIGPCLVYGDRWARREDLSGFIYGAKNSLFFHQL